MSPHIAFDRLGTGSPVILVLGAFNTRDTGEPLAHALAERHTVLNYDRRGRGDSSDEPTYAVEREIDDLAGLIDKAGGSAALVGFSSGAALALAAAAHGLPVTKLALFDLPLRPGGPPNESDHAAKLDELVRAGRRGDAVEYFQGKMVGIPQPVIEQMRNAPFRPALDAMAHTLVYEAQILGNGLVPLDQVRAVAAPVLAIAGGAAPAFMRMTAERVAREAKHGRALVIEGLGHELSPALAAPLTEFFA